MVVPDFRRNGFELRVEYFLGVDALPTIRL